MRSWLKAAEGPGHANHVDGRGTMRSGRTNSLMSPSAKRYERWNYGVLTAVAMSPATIGFR